MRLSVDKYNTLPNKVLCVDVSVSKQRLVRLDRVDRAAGLLRCPFQGKRYPALERDTRQLRFYRELDTPVLVGCEFDVKLLHRPSIASSSVHVYYSVLLLSGSTG